MYDGLWKYFYDNGNPDRELTYKSGMPNGAVMQYNREGVLIQQGFYLDGKEHGEWKFFDDQGRLTFSGWYEHGERVGEWFQYDKKGNRKIWRY